MAQQIMQFDPAVNYGRQALAEKLGIAPRTVSRRVARRQLPRPVKVGRDPFWPGRVLQEWIEAKATR